MNPLLDVDAPRLLALEEAARRVGKSVKTVYRWQRQGLIRQYGERGEQMFFESELDTAKETSDAARIGNLGRPRRRVAGLA